MVARWKLDSNSQPYRFKFVIAPGTYRIRTGAGLQAHVVVKNGRVTKVNLISGCS
jgi:hypothetical protein